MFSGKSGARLLEEIAAARSIMPGGPAGTGENRLTGERCRCGALEALSKLNDAAETQINKIKVAINEAGTIEEVNRLEKALRVPSHCI